MQNKDKFEKLDKCPYCVSENLIFVFSAPNRFGSGNELFSLTKCGQCNLVFQNPRVKEEFVGDYYSDDLHYYKPTPINKKKIFKDKIKAFLYKQVLINHLNYFKLGRKNFLIKLFTLPFRSRFLIHLIPKFIEDGTILDIGCAYGANLVRLRDLGWNVMGLEMNDTSASIARDNGLDVRTGKIEHNSFFKESFDAVLMGMVLEHLHKPFISLKKVTDWIKPGGQLIFSIPYFEGFEFSLFREYAYGVQLPHHITFFNKNIIKEYLSKLGYKDIKFYFQYFDRDFVSSAGYKYEDKKSFIYKIISQSRIFRLFVIRPLVYLMSLFHQTSRVTVYAIKK